MLGKMILNGVQIGRHAFCIGIISGIVLYLGHHLLFLLRVDDPCDACVVHGFCGVWGLLATGIFCTDQNVIVARLCRKAAALNDAMPLR